MSTPVFNSIAYSDNVVGSVCGEFMEISIHPEAIQAGAQQTNRDPTSKVPETPEEILNRSVKRSQRTIRRLVNANRLYYMHTLTYAITHPQYFNGEKPFVLRSVDHQKDRDSVILDWKQFARKMRLRVYRKTGNEFRYIAVIEKHSGKRAKDKTIKTGCYHIHFVSDVLFPKRLLQHVWRHGLCNYSDWTKGRKAQDLDTQDSLPPPDNPGAYMSKYTGKDFAESEIGKKRYWRSRNLKAPETHHGKEALQLIVTGNKLYERLIEREVDGKTFRTYYATYYKKGGFTGEQNENTTDKDKKRIKKARVRLHVKRLQAEREKRYEREKSLHRIPSCRRIETDFNRQQHLDTYAKKTTPGVAIYPSTIKNPHHEYHCRIRLKIKGVRNRMFPPQRASSLGTARPIVVFQSRARTETQTL